MSEFYVAAYQLSGLKNVMSPLYVSVFLISKAEIIVAHPGDVVNLHTIRAIITILFSERFSVLVVMDLFLLFFSVLIATISYVPCKLTVVTRKFPSSNPVVFKRHILFRLHRTH